ncbi:MAG: hypothetical protein JXA57_21125 [Armatimonadetes bacterium]|nr:hypothetical protein [Armatimonadota bacterium]
MLNNTIAKSWFDPVVLAAGFAAAACRWDGALLASSALRPTPLTHR